MARVEALSPAEWLTAARKCLGFGTSEALTLQEVEALPTDDEEEVQGFIGDRLAVRVSVRRDTHGTSHEAALYLKAVPVDNAARLRIALDTRAFHKESGLYAHVFSRMRAVAPLTDQPTPWAPRCFVATPQLLVFEDLRSSGWEAPGNRGILSLEECVATLDAMARFHAAAIVLDERMREEGLSLHEQYADLMRENMLTASGGGGGLYTYMQRSCEAISHLASLLPEAHSPPAVSAADVRSRAPPLLLANVLRLAASSTRFRNALCHGDVWISNIMLQRRKSAQEGPKAVLVDFQTCRWAPPAHDVECLLHTCIRREMRDTEGQNLRRGYHTTLIRSIATALGRSAKQAEQLLPWEDFAAASAEQRPLARTLASCFHCNDLLPPSELQTALQASASSGDPGAETLLTRNRIPTAEAAFTTDPQYRERLSEDLLELLQEDILPALASYEK